jgi:hypothetical protein
MLVAAFACVRLRACVCARVCGERVLPIFLVSGNGSGFRVVFAGVYMRIDRIELCYNNGLYKDVGVVSARGCWYGP